MGEKSILAALAMASVPSDGDESSDVGSALKPKLWTDCVTQAYAQLPDYGALADRLHTNRFEPQLEKKLEWLPHQARPTVGIPVLTMSAYPISSVADLLERISKSGSPTATCEFKYDGARVQIHFSSSPSDPSAPTRERRIFSRNMEDITEKYGSLLDVLERQLQLRYPSATGSTGVSVILEGEVVAMNRTTGEFHPFQVLQAKATTEFCLFAFDLLSFNGESLLKVGCYLCLLQQKIGHN